MSLSEIVGIETPVTDFLYDENRANKELREEFFKRLRPAQPPRKGENLFITIEAWEQALLDFADAQGLTVGAGTKQEKVERVREAIFGPPRAITAGGAVANTIDALTKARISGVPFVKGTFVTAIGEGVAGEIFAESMEGKLVTAPVKGRQMEAHVFPVDGDRILVSMASNENPTYRNMSAAQLDFVSIDANTKLVVLGGYMDPTGKYPEFFNAVLRRIVAVSPDPRKRPTLVLTAASQDIANGENIAKALRAAREETSVIVFANTGEFRRLMRMDQKWREPLESHFVLKNEKDEIVRDKNGDPIRLQGSALENAKRRDEAYKAAKLDANKDACEAASVAFCRSSLPVTFVVTNGGSGVYVVNGEGASRWFKTPPAPNGVVNTVGGGDGFAGGYLLGQVSGLPVKDCVDLGFVCAGQIIGQDEARLSPRSATFNDGPFAIGASGLPAYLDPRNEPQMALLKRLSEAQSAGKEIERKYLVDVDEWQRVEKDICEPSYIEQYYLPDASAERASGGVRLGLNIVDGVLIARAEEERGDDICSFIVRPDEFAPFWTRETLRLVTAKDGSVPVGPKVEARIRFKNGAAVMTIKRAAGGAQRHELEFPIPLDAAETLKKYCPTSIAKTRYAVHHKGMKWEVDEYKNQLFNGRPLVIAEVELPHRDYHLEKPAFVADEVTDKPEYSNRRLAAPVALSL